MFSFAKRTYVRTEEVRAACLKQSGLHSLNATGILGRIKEGKTDDDGQNEKLGGEPEGLGPVSRVAEEATFGEDK